MLCIFILYSTGYLTWGLILERTSNYEPPQKLFFLLDMFFIYDRDIDRFDIEKFMI